MALDGGTRWRHSTVDRPQVASFAQVEAPAEDVEMADVGDEGPRRGSDRPGPTRDSSGDQETALADVDAGGREAAAAAAAGDEDEEKLPGGPALFGERPLDR